MLVVHGLQVGINMLVVYGEITSDVIMHVVNTVVQLKNTDDFVDDVKADPQGGYVASGPDVTCGVNVFNTYTRALDFMESTRQNAGVA